MGLPLDMLRQRKKPLMNSTSQLLNSDAFIRAIVQRTDLEANMSEGPKIVEQTISKARKAIRLHAYGLLNFCSHQTNMYRFLLMEGVATVGTL